MAHARVRLLAFLLIAALAPPARAAAPGADPVPAAATPPSPQTTQAAGATDNLDNYWRDKDARGQPEVFAGNPAVSEDNARAGKLAKRWDKSPQMRSEAEQLAEQLQERMKEKTPEGVATPRAVNAARLMVMLRQTLGEEQKLVPADREFITMALASEGPARGSRRVVLELDRRAYVGDLPGVGRGRAILLESISLDKLPPYELYRSAALYSVGIRDDRERAQSLADSEVLCRLFIMRFPKHEKMPSVKKLLARCLLRTQKPREAIATLKEIQDVWDAADKQIIVAAYQNMLLRRLFRDREEMRKAYEELARMKGQNPNSDQLLSRTLQRFESTLRIQ